jgi:hypothetical protein
MIGWYLLAKGFEVLDTPIFDLGKVVSGHSLKHLASALATYVLVYMLARRRLISRPAGHA